MLLLPLFTIALVKEIHFTPSNKCADLVMRQLDKAKERVRIAMYSLTDKQIIEKINKTAKRGIIISLIAECNDYNEFLEKIDIMRDIDNIICDKRSAYEHNKFMIVDDTQVVTGSYDWTEHARENSENCLLIEDKDYIYRDRFFYLVFEFYNEFDIDFCINFLRKKKSIRKPFSKDDIHGIEIFCQQKLEYHNLEL
ncbi:MAG: phospholipase D-like domain-containing protein [Rickettsiales bacterium]|jgi:phospholipase D|nr:phospholipase D-like domain-containing protein [Rickettsiales bacterium]